MKITFEYTTPGELTLLLQEFATFLRGQHATDVIVELTQSLAKSTQALQSALMIVNPTSESNSVMAATKMVGASPALEALRQQVEKTNTVLGSATAFITGVPALITTAVDQAMANGATAAELAPLTELGNSLSQNADALAAAVAANTPAPPSP